MTASLTEVNSAHLDPNAAADHNAESVVLASSRSIDQPTIDAPWMFAKLFGAPRTPHTKRQEDRCRANHDDDSGGLGNIIPGDPWAIAQAMVCGRSSDVRRNE